MASSTDWKLANDFVDCMRCPNFGAVVEVVEEVEEVVVVQEEEKEASLIVEKVMLWYPCLPLFRRCT